MYDSASYLRRRLKYVSVSSLRRKYEALSRKTPNGRRTRLPKRLSLRRKSQLWEVLVVSEQYSPILARNLTYCQYKSPVVFCFILSADSQCFYRLQRATNLAYTVSFCRYAYAMLNWLVMKMAGQQLVPLVDVHDRMRQLKKSAQKQADRYRTWRNRRSAPSQTDESDIELSDILHGRVSGFVSKRSFCFVSKQGFCKCCVASEAHLNYPFLTVCFVSYFVDCYHILYY